MGTDILSGIIQVLISIVNGLITIVLAPISLLIKTALPGVDQLFGSVADWLGYMTTYPGWVIDALGIPTAVISIIALFYVFKVSTSLSAYGIKLGIKWWEALKP